MSADKQVKSIQAINYYEAYKVIAQEKDSKLRVMNTSLRSYTLDNRTLKRILPVIKEGETARHWLYYRLLLGISEAQMVKLHAAVTVRDDLIKSILAME